MVQRAIPEIAALSRCIPCVHTHRIDALASQAATDGSSKEISGLPQTGGAYDALSGN